MKTNCTIHTYINDIEVHRLGDYSIPPAVNDINELDLLLTNLRKTDVEEYISKPCNATTLIQLVISLFSVLEEESFKHINTLKFVCQQLR